MQIRGIVMSYVPHTLMYGKISDYRISEKMLGEGTKELI